MRAATRAVPDRNLAVFAPAQKPVLVYTDASANGFKVRIGALLVADGDEFFCTVLDPDDHIATPWKCREDSDVAITPAEPYAVLVAFQTFEVHSRGRDVFWFIGNQAAGACFAKAGSQVPALSLLALRATSLMGAMGCRVWAEYVLSTDYFVGALSREGLEDTALAAKIAAGGWRYVPPCRDAALEVAGLDFESIWTRRAHS